MGAGRRCVLGLVAVAAVAMPGAVWAETPEIILSRAYVRAAGTPVTVAEAFRVCDPGGAFTLAVDNGPGGEERVSSAALLVNGIEVVHEADLNQQVGRLERPLGALLADNTLEVRLRSQVGGTIMVSILGVQACGIRITSPTAGAVVPAGAVLVRGTVPVPASGDVGVTVNDVPAILEQGIFVAPVPVDPTVSRLRATARDSGGAVLGEHEVAITVQPGAGAPLSLEVAPPGGLAPLAVTFALPPLAGTGVVELDLEGDGVVEFRGPTLDGQAFTYPAAGVYTPTARLTDAQGRVHTAVAVVQVSDPSALDARLQAVWQGLRDALRAGDPARAAGFVHADLRARFLTQVAQLRGTTLAAIDRYLPAIRLVKAGFGGAQYEALRPEGGVTYSFGVWFQLDEDGHWRVVEF